MKSLIRLFRLKEEGNNSNKVIIQIDQSSTLYLMVIYLSFLAECLSLLSQTYYSKVLATFHAIVKQQSSNTNPWNYFVFDGKTSVRLKLSLPYQFFSLQPFILINLFDNNSKTICYRREQYFLRYKSGHQKVILSVLGYEQNLLKMVRISETINRDSLGKSFVSIYPIFLH